MKNGDKRIENARVRDRESINKFAENTVPWSPIRSSRLRDKLHKRLLVPRRGKLIASEGIVRRLTCSTKKKISDAIMRHFVFAEQEYLSGTHNE